MKSWMLLLYLVFVIAVLGFCFDYSLWSIAGKDIPWYADVIAGVVTNAVVFATAIICWILRLCGVPVPFIG